MRKRGNVNYHQVIALHREHPTWDSRELAKVLGCDPGYVRATAQRRNLAIKPKPRVIKNPRKAQRVYRSAHSGEGSAERIYFSVKEQLAEVFYEFFEPLFATRTAFELQLLLAVEFERAQRRGQTITGFLLGDPLPARSALAKRK